MIQVKILATEALKKYHIPMIPVPITISSESLEFYTTIYSVPGSPTTIFYRLVSEPPLF